MPGAGCCCCSLWTALFWLTERMSWLEVYWGRAASRVWYFFVNWGYPILWRMGYCSCLTTGYRCWFPKLLRRQSSGGFRFNPDCRRVTIQEFLPLMVNRIRTGDPCGFNKGCSSKFCVGSRLWQIPVEGQRTYRPKCCGNKYKDKDNSLKTLNDKNRQASSQN